MVYHFTTRGNQIFASAPSILELLGRPFPWHQIYCTNLDIFFPIIGIFYAEIPSTWNFQTFAAAIQHRKRWILRLSQKQCGHQIQQMRWILRDLMSSIFEKIPTESVELSLQLMYFWMASAQEHLAANDYASAKVICVNNMLRWGYWSRGYWLCLFSPRYYPLKFAIFFWTQRMRRILGVHVKTKRSIFFGILPSDFFGRWSWQNHSCSEFGRPNKALKLQGFGFSPPTWWKYVEVFPYPFGFQRILDWWKKGKL